MSATSSRSISPFQPHQQLTHHALPTLDELVGYLLASKRSLATAHNNIHIANGLVAAGGNVVSSIALTAARNSFLIRSLHNQINTLRAVHHGLALVIERGLADFKDVLTTLDNADVAMKQMLDVLRRTPVHGEARGISTALETVGTSIVSQSKQQTLHDFVDEAAVEAILTAFRASIDEVTEAQDGLEQSIESFESEIVLIEKALLEAANTQPFPVKSRSFADELDSGYIKGHDHKRSDFTTAHDAYQALEGHATEMAQLLQSLISHYDFCVKALRHTDGGGEVVAAEEAEGHRTYEEHEPVTHHTLFMPEDERQEMLKVLSSDAEEVDDVVNELSEHAARIDTLYKDIQNILATTMNQQRQLRNVVGFVTTVGEKLTLYVEAGAIFERRWVEQKEVIASKLQDLEDLKAFYQGFIKAYGKLQGEIARRNDLQEKIEEVLAVAMKKVERLYQEDLEHRDVFQAEHGQFLPMDIWPELSNSLKKYQIVSMPPDQAQRDSRNAE